MQKLYNGSDVRARRIFKATANISNNTLNTQNNNSNSGAQNILPSQNQSANGTISTQKPNNPIDRCSRYDSKLTQCLMCDTGYTLVNQACYYAIEGCLSYQ